MTFQIVEDIMGRLTVSDEDSDRSRLLSQARQAYGLTAFETDELDANGRVTLTYRADLVLRAKPAQEF